MNTIHVIGIDPGPVTGVVRLALTSENPWRHGLSKLTKCDALQVTPGALFDVLAGLVAVTPRAAIAVERFVVGPRAAKSSTAKAGELTRELVTEIYDWARAHEAIFQMRSAADVKPWATDARLDKAGLLDLTTGMRHARDAGRHALYEACNDWGLSNPLSAAWGREL